MYPDFSGEMEGAGIYIYIMIYTCRKRDHDAQKSDFSHLKVISRGFRWLGPHPKYWVTGQCPYENPTKKEWDFVGELPILLDFVTDFPATSDFCLGELARIWKPRRLTKPYDFFGVGSYDIQLHHRNVIAWNPSFGYKETAGHIMFWSHISSMLVRFKLFVCGTSCHRRCFLLISAFHPIPPGVVVKNPRGQQAPQLADGKKNWSTNWESCPPQPVATLVTCVHHCNCNKCMYILYIVIYMYTMLFLLYIKILYVYIKISRAIWRVCMYRRMYVYVYDVCIYISVIIQRSIERMQTHLFSRRRRTFPSADWTGWCWANPSGRALSVSWLLTHESLGTALSCFPFLLRF